MYTDINKNININKASYDISFFNDASFITVWTKKYNDYYDLEGRKYDHEGVQSNKKFKVIGDIRSKDAYLKVEANNDGTFIILWINSNNAYGYNLFCAKYSSDLEMVGNINKVNDLIGSISKNPSIAVNDDGSYIVAWHDICKYGYDQCLYYQKFTTNSLKIDLNLRIDNVQSYKKQLNVKILQLNTSILLAVWDQINSSDTRSVFAKFIDINNSINNKSIEIGSKDGVEKRFPRITLVDKESALIAWEQLNSQGIKSVFATFLNTKNQEQSLPFAMQGISNIKHASLQLSKFADHKVLISYTTTDNGIIEKYHADIYYDVKSRSVFTVEGEIISNSSQIIRCYNDSFAISTADYIDEDFSTKIVQYDGIYRNKTMVVSTKYNTPPVANSFEQDITEREYLKFWEHAFDEEDKIDDLRIIVLKLPTFGSIEVEQGNFKLGDYYQIREVLYVATDCHLDYNDLLQFVIIDTQNSRSTLETVYIKSHKFHCPPIADSLPTAVSVNIDITERGKIDFFNYLGNIIDNGKLSVQFINKLPKGSIKDGVEAVSLNKLYSMSNISYTTNCIDAPYTTIVEYVLNDGFGFESNSAYIRINAVKCMLKDTESTANISVNTTNTNSTTNDTTNVENEQTGILNTVWGVVVMVVGGVVTVGGTVAACVLCYLSRHRDKVHPEQGISDDPEQGINHGRRDDGADDNNRRGGDGGASDSNDVNDYNRSNVQDDTLALVDFDLEVNNIKSAVNYAIISYTLSYLEHPILSISPLNLEIELVNNKKHVPLYTLTITSIDNDTISGGMSRSHYMDNTIDHIYCISDELSNALNCTNQDLLIVI